MACSKKHTTHCALLSLTFAALAACSGGTGETTSQTSETDPSGQTSESTTDTTATTATSTTMDTTAGPTTDPTTSTTGTPTQCGDGTPDNAFYDPPGECYNNVGCETCNCLTFRDTPPDPGATCQPDPGDDNMRITGTVLSFPDGAPVAGATFDLLGAISILGGLDTAEPELSSMSMGDGTVDVTYEPTDAIGVVALLGGDGYAITASGIAPPPYEPANAVHDFYIVPDANLAAWNTALMNDADMAEFLPLGEMGGVVGIARNRYTGDPVEGLTIVSKTNGDTTGALIRYLAGDGTFGTGGTTETGIYVLVNPALAEEFEAVMGNDVVSTRANKAGSGAGGVFTMNLSIDIDPGFNPFE